jgi:hypothetical protein
VLARQMIQKGTRQTAHIRTRTRTRTRTMRATAHMVRLTFPSPFLVSPFQAS